VQGVGRLALGSLYFASGDPQNGWENATDHFKQSVGMFHTPFTPGCNKDEAIAEFALGRLYWRQWAISGRDKYHEAVVALEKSKELICDINDELFLAVERSLNELIDQRRRIVMADNQDQAGPEVNQRVPPGPAGANAAPGGNGGAGGGHAAPNGPQGNGGAGGNGHVRKRTANYCVKVIPQERLATKRRFQKPSWRDLVGFVLAFLATFAGVTTVVFLHDWVAQIVVFLFFILIVGLFGALIIYWRLHVTAQVGKVSIITGGDSPEFVHPGGARWRLPLRQKVFDEVPMPPLTFGCRIEFRENESAAMPELYQDIIVQYIVAVGQPREQHPPLERAVLNRLALTEKSNAESPMREYWNNQIGEGLQRFFEDSDPDEICNRISNPEETLSLEGEIMDFLQGRSDWQGWGIQVPDVHLRHFQSKK
jgi:hypothetical protein